MPWMSAQLAGDAGQSSQALGGRGGALGRTDKSLEVWSK